LVVFVLALVAPVLAVGAPHAAKNVDVAANKINRSVFFITILPRSYSISKGGFKLQVQQVNSFSLQRSEMFIAAGAQPKTSVRNETRQRNLRRRQPKAIALLRSFGVKKDR